MCKGCPAFNRNSIVKIKEVTPTSKEVSTLIRELDEYHNSIYPEGSHALDSIDELSKDNVIFLAAYDSGIAIGCGAIKFLKEGYAELKRMYVSPKGRRTGVGKEIIESLEGQAVLNGYSTIMVENGTHQDAARNLYSSIGFKECGPFGGYPKNALSVFMVKELNA